MKQFVAALVLLAALILPAPADPAFTGDVPADFTDPNTQVFYDYRNDPYRDYVVPAGLEKDVGMPVPAFTVDDISGWDIKATYYYYNKTSDRLYIGIDFYVIGGDADGNGDPSGTSPQLASKGGVDYPDLTQEESICMTIDPDFNGVHDLVVGISSYASDTDFGTFTFMGDKNAPALGFGSRLDPDTAVLFSLPNATCPDFEFYIDQFSHLPKFKFRPGESFKFKTRSFGGSLGDDGIGEDLMRSWVYCNYTDFGDAPSSYKTLSNDGGAVHIIIPGLRLGELIDDEMEGQPSEDASGDDLSSQDDEDGVAFYPHYTGNPARVTVNATGRGLLFAWMDFNGDGSWSGPDEQILADRPIEPGENDLTFQVPAAARGGNTFARFRFSTSAGLSFDGPAPDGEVEDYLVTIVDSAHLGDRVWKDYDRDGVQDPGEPGLPDVLVELFDPQEQMVASARTNASGLYEFQYIPPGDYYLVFFAPEYYSFSPRDRGDEDVDCDAGANGRTDLISLSSGQVDLDRDAGLFVDGAIEANKTAFPSSGAPSTQVQNIIQIKNSGKVRLDSVIAVDTLPQGLSYVSDNRSGTVNGQQISWILGPLEPEEAHFIELFAQMDGDVFGEITNQIDARGILPTGDETDNSSSADIAVLKPELEVMKRAAPFEGAPSTNVQFAVKITNTGNVSLGLTQVQDTLPDGLSYVSDNRSGTANANIITWSDLGTLQPGQSQFLELIAQVDGSVFGELVNQIEVIGQPPTGDAVYNSSDAVISALQPNIEIVKIANPQEGARSTNVQFAVKITNTGNVSLGLTQVQDTLPDGLSYVSDNRSGTANANIITWSDLGTLQPGQSLFLELVAQVDGSVFGELVNQIEAIARPPTGDSIRNATTANITALKPNIEVVKTASPKVGTPLSEIEFAIEIINSGNTALNTIEATDILPEGLSYHSDNRSGKASGRTILWEDLGSLEPGASLFIRMTAQVDASVFGDLTNLVEVLGRPPTGDPVANFTAENVTAINVRSIVGRKFNDLNGDGIQEGDPDPGIPGWTIELVDETGRVARMAITDENGFYRMDGVPAGEYILREVPQEGWIQTAPKDGYYRIVVKSSDIQGMDFGNQLQRAILGDLIWKDLDLDGIQDPGEPGIPGITVNLLPAEGAGDFESRAGEAVILDQKKTDQNGRYRFENILPGSYRIKFEIPEGCCFSPKGHGDRECDCDAGADGVTRIIVMQAGQEDLSWDAGVRARSSLEVTKTASPTSASPGAEISFEITIFNRGETTVSQLKATDTLPQGLSYISDDRQGEVSGGMVTWKDLGELQPGDSLSIKLVGQIDKEISGTLTNSVRASGLDPSGQEIEAAASADVTSLIPEIEVVKTYGLPEPLQFGEYCDSKTIRGEGSIESNVRVKDKKIALEYDSALEGEGEIELQSSQALSQSASRLKREVPSLDQENESSLNFFEQTRLSFKGLRPLSGRKTIQSRELYGGSGAMIEEAFNVEEMEETQDIYFGTTTNATSAKVMGMDLKSRFVGAMRTESQMRRMLKQEVRSRQSLAGRFELEKAIKLHERPQPPQPQLGCEGIDC